jgi:hypothetical protein
MFLALINGFGDSPRRVYREGFIARFTLTRPTLTGQPSGGTVMGPSVTRNGTNAALMPGSLTIPNYIHPSGL